MQTLQISRQCAEAIGKVLSRFDLESNRNRYMMGQAELDIDMILKIDLLTERFPPSVKCQLTIDSQGKLKTKLLTNNEEIKLEVK